MKKLLSVLLFFSVIVLPSFAQGGSIYQRREVIELNDDDDNLKYEIFAMDLEEGSQYFLNVGHLGFGNEVVQVQLDPVFSLYIKLGDSLSEAISSMEELVSQVKARPGTVVETVGYLNLAVPDEKGTEAVTITTRKPLISRYLEFSVQREGYIRSSDIPKSDLSSMLFSLKTYRKIHPKEK